jgi:hypothetical protein
MDIDEEITNGIPIYGHNTMGSLGRKILRKDLMEDRLLLLKVPHKVFTLVKLLNELVIKYSLNFITLAIAKYIYHDDVMDVLIRVNYPDEIDEFMSRIRTINGLEFSAWGHLIKVFPVPDCLIGVATTDTALCTDSRHIRNIHFNYTPNNSVSPSHNLLNIAERIEADPLLVSDIAGISLKLDKKQKTLYHFGSFVLFKSTDKSACLSRIMRMGFTASHASYTTFLLLERQIVNVRGHSADGFVENLFLLKHNLLTKKSSIYNETAVVEDGVMVEERFDPLVNSLISSTQLRAILPQIVRDVASELGLGSLNNKFTRRANVRDRRDHRFRNEKH